MLPIVFFLERHLSERPELYIRAGSPGAPRSARIEHFKGAYGDDRKPASHRLPRSACVINSFHRTRGLRHGLGLRPSTFCVAILARR